ncbi:hypothetical protein APA_5153 [Pseudanabaena sp. lw0831]|nr:hypothetical protein APA_5153 [Pseudanabaena sp. lw0831]
MLERTQNPKESCGALRRNSLLGFMSSHNWRSLKIQIIKGYND